MGLLGFSEWATFGGPPWTMLGNPVTCDCKSSLVQANIGQDIENNEAQRAFAEQVRL